MTTTERLRSYMGDRQIDRDQLTSLAARYWYVAAFASLIAVALGLRLWGLGDRAIHHDESLHMFYAWELFQGSGYEHIPFMHGPFQFFGSALTFRLFGDSDFTARLLYAAFGAALVGMPFLLRSYIGRSGALIAAGLLAISPTLLYFSRFARNDIYIAVFTLATVIVIWRYLKEQKQSYLYALPVLLMLGFVTKEVTFITTAIFLIYLEFQLTSDLVDQLRASRSMRPVEVALTYVALVPTAWLIAIFWPLLEGPRKRWSLTTLPAAGHLAIIMGTFALPQFAAGVQKIPFLSLGDADVFNGPDEGTVKVLAIVIFFAASAYIGLLWNWRVWAIGAVLFYIPFFLLYTTFFTNGGDIWNVYTFFTNEGGGLWHTSGQFWRGEGGFWTGIWGSLDYWLSQQLVRRGSQPDYYYFITLPVYEFLPLVFATGGALYYAFRGKLEQKLLAAAALLLVVFFSVLPDSVWLIGDYRIHAAFLIAIGAVLVLSIDGFTKFLLFWMLSIFFGITVAGEKMPWLTVHLALPVALLAAKVLDDVLSSVGTAKAAASVEAPPERGRRGGRKEAKGLPFERLLPLGAGATLAVASAATFIAFGPSSATSILPWLLAAAALGAVVWAASSVSWQAAGQVAVVGLFAALLVFTVRAGATAAFDEGTPDSYPQELLIYAQGSPKLGLIREEIERLATESGLGDDLNVVIDNSVNVWPWPWYMRGRPYQLENFDGDFEPKPGSVVLISNANQPKIQPFVDQYQDPIPYKHMWWFPERYKGLDTNGFLGDAFTLDLLNTWRSYFIDRQLRDASESPDMLAYFPNELGFVIDVPVTPDVAGPADPLPAESLEIVGGAGEEAGQFSRPADLVLDAEGNLYVVDSLNHRIQKLARDGSVLTIGSEGADAEEFANPRSDDYQVDDGPWGIGVDADGNIYVADTWNHRIQKFGPDLEFIQEWGGGLFGPRDLAIDSKGNLLVVDTGNHRIVAYTTDGQLVDEIGREGGGEGEFREPTSVSVAANGDIYVADFWNQRIQRFNADFGYLDEISVPTWGSRGVTDRAYIVALPDGRVLATDPANARIIVLAATGEEVASWSLPSPIGSRPVGITVNALGDVYISDGLTSQITRLPLATLLKPRAP